MNMKTPHDFSPFSLLGEYSLCGTFRTRSFVYIFEPEPLALLLSDDVRTFLTHRMSAYVCP